MAERRPWMSPYVFYSDNPVNRIDMNGNWDVSVHLAQNRSQNGYGVAIVSDRNGNEVYRFQVRAEGVGGTYQNTDYQNSVEGNVGFINGSSSTEKSTTSDINTTDGYSTKSDQSSKEVESGGIIAKQVKGDGNDRFELNSGVSANALMVGVEAKSTITYEPSVAKSSNQPSNNSNKTNTQVNNQNSNNQQNPTPLKTKEAWKLF
jgi:hypothetical protein